MNRVGWGCETEVYDKSEQIVELGKELTRLRKAHNSFYDESVSVCVLPSLRIAHATVR